MALKTAFCCLTLRTGTLVVGWGSLIIVIIQAVLLIVPEIVEEGENIIPGLASYDHWERADSWTYYFKDKLSSRVFCIGVFVTAAVSIVIFINLLYGTYARRARFLLPYLVVVGILVGVASVLVIYLYTIGVNRFILITKYISVPFLIYFLFIVGSHYGELRSSEDHEVKSEVEA